MASNENGYLGGMMVSYPFRDIEPSTVNDCFGSSVLVAANVGYRAEKRVDEGRLGVKSDSSNSPLREAHPCADHLPALARP
ncbi:hypothetical protein [Mesorhizobium sp.]|uniref:hypothetical protein n=1 Tax=Mesorhizobium sp. TaxID=1871066 RepID=UPI002579BF0B|nr:hypothetical protein [Mesorhizobium sp.]